MISAAMLMLRFPQSNRECSVLPAASNGRPFQLARRGSPFRLRSTFAVSVLAIVVLTTLQRSAALADNVQFGASLLSLDSFVGVWLGKKPDGRSIVALTFTRSGDELVGTIKEYSAAQVKQVSSYRIVLVGTSARLHYTENGKDYDFTSTTMLPDLIRFEREIIKKPALYAIQIGILNDGSLQIIDDIGTHGIKPPLEAVYQRFLRISAAP